MRGATGTPPFIFVFSPISIHAPHAGRDSQFPRPAPCRCISIHAPHAGRDACPAYHSQSRSCYFNPRAPCGARPQGARRMNIRAKISIHAPHAGRDGAASPRVSVAWIFQSTRPMRGATGARQFKTRRYQHFNPRAPCGARRNQRRRHAFTTLFQSTRPMRGATCVQDGTIYDS